MAPSIKEQPVDLRLLGEKFGTPFSIERVASYVDGREAPRMGRASCPVWGERFYDIWNAKGSPGGMQGRITEIVLSLRTIQLKHPPGNAVAGGDTATPH